jgi:hypothetical protein
MKAHFKTTSTGLVIFHRPGKHGVRVEVLTPEQAASYAAPTRLVKTIKSFFKLWA